MGTPGFAVPALKALQKGGYNVALVITQPDRPVGRGRRLTTPPVKEAAIQLGYDLIQPAKMGIDKLEESILRHKPDIFVVVAFGRILTKNILALPKTGAINIHASILPKYRGPAPIQWAIINGEKETGVTTMLIDEGLDTGDILLSSKIRIAHDDTSATLYDRLANLGAELLIRTLKALETGGINPLPQDDSQATYAPLLKKNDGRIDWKMPAKNLEAFIRGMTPWPGAFTFCGEKRLKVLMARSILTDVDKAPGTVIEGVSDRLYVATGKGVLSILQIQEASRKRLSIKDFLQGHRVPKGTVLR